MNNSNTSKTEPLAICSLVLGILSIFFLIFTALPAIICGHIARKRLRNNTTLTGRGMALAGLIIGYVSLSLTVLALVPILVMSNMANTDKHYYDVAKAQRSAQNICSVASLARIAGYTNTWETKERAIQEIRTGIFINSQSFESGSDMSSEEIESASKHLNLVDGQLLYVP